MKQSGKNIFDSEELPLILAYIYSELNIIHAREIAEKINSDTELMVMLEGIIQIKEAKGFLSSKEHQVWLDRKRKVIDDTFQIYQKKSRRKIYKYFTYAASVIGLMIYIINLPLYSGPKLYEKFQSKPGFENPNISQVSADTQNAISSYYTDNEYLTAVNEFNKILDLDSSLMSIKLYAGYCYLELGNLDEAINYFSSVAHSTSDQTLKNQALWQIGMTYIKAKDFKHAIPAFQEVAATSNDEIYHLDKQAKKILWRAKLRSFFLENIVYKVKRT